MKCPIFGTIHSAVKLGRSSLPLALVISVFLNCGCRREGQEKPSEAEFMPLQEVSEVSGKPRIYDHEKSVDVKLYCAGDSKEPGLKIEILESMNWKSFQELNFTYRITNSLDDEVFVEVQNLHKVGCSYDGPEGSAGGGVGSGIEFPGNLTPLRRLTSNGIDVCFADVKAVTNVPIFASERGVAAVNIRITGFLRANGRRFEDFVEVPIPLKDRPKPVQ